MRFSGRIAMWLSLLTAQHALAQLPNTFRWSFDTAVVAGGLEECLILQVALEPVDNSNPPAGSFGVPPFYMLAFEPGGVPTTSVLGSDPTQLAWQVNHVRGSELMLAVVDSAGNTGGVSDVLYNIAAGSDISCLLPSSPPVVTVQANVSDNLSTCQPWGLTITGGERPYTVVLSQLQSSTITVVTMSDDDDTFTYINRANTDRQMMASVYDALGLWGTSTGAVQSTSTADATCPGLVSSESASASGSIDESFAASIRPFPSAASFSYPASSTTGLSMSASTSIMPSTAAVENRSVSSTSPGVPLAVGLSLGLGIPLLALLVVAVWFCTRKKREQPLKPASPIDMLASPVKSNRYSMRDAIVATSSDLRLYLLGHSRTPSSPNDFETGLAAVPYSDDHAMEANGRRRSTLFSPWERLEPVPETRESAVPSRPHTPTDFAAGHDLYSTVLVDVPAIARTPSPAAAPAHDQIRRIAQVYLRPSSSRGSLSQLRREPEHRDVIPRTASPDSIGSRSSRDGFLQTEDSHYPTTR
ncbi:hypothetical protein PsYK624_126190 [Phanerochaete sordida]|uniref:Mid2 domain-containing protein n=1 Tax=Phanerochaete sordida TaxID=48140 RepID=A0A9P3GJN8_9APHY|nr:hypothetical protein PsYK624_126190 [Phanerochaete sordida]